MPTVIIPPTDVSPNTGTGSEVLATNPVFPSNVTIQGATASTSSSTGALVVTGGAGIGGALYTGGNATVGGTLTVSGAGGITTTAPSAATQSITVNAYNSLSGVSPIKLEAYSPNQSNTESYAILYANSQASGGPVLNEVARFQGQTKATTLAGNLTVSGGTVSGVASGLTSTLIKASGFGYAPQNYSSIQLGGTSGRSLAFGVDVSAISGGNFTGASNEWLVPNTLNIRQVNAGGTDFTGYALRLIDTSAEIGGNLTVSGTGTSTFGGKIQSSVATATGYNQLYDTTGITTGRGAFAITSTGAGLAFGIESSAGGTSFTGSTAYASYFGTTTATPIHLVTNSSISATLTSGGNLLLGTTTDGGQRLQVAGGSYFAHSTAEDQFNFYNTAATPTYSILLRLKQVNTSANPPSTYLIYADVGTGAGAVKKFSVSESGKVSMPSLPTSSSGLSAGDIWNDGGTLKIV